MAEMIEVFSYGIIFSEVIENIKFFPFFFKI